jgi:hypothetical protein
LALLDTSIECFCVAVRAFFNTFISFDSGLVAKFCVNSDFYFFVTFDEFWVLPHVLCLKIIIFEFFVTKYVEILTVQFGEAGTKFPSLSCPQTLPQSSVGSAS